jgi:hypothetical protein
LGFLTGTKKVVQEVKLGQAPALTNQIAWGKVSLKSLEITNDNRAFSCQRSAVSGLRSADTLLHFVDGQVPIAS